MKKQRFFSKKSDDEAIKKYLESGGSIEKISEGTISKNLEKNNESITGSDKTIFVKIFNESDEMFGDNFPGKRKLF